MKLVRITPYTDNTGVRFINMDYITSVIHIAENEYYASVLNEEEDFHSITKEAYETILSYGKAEV